MAAAIFRVKRKRCENPADSFVVSCKKIKSNTGVNDADSEEISGQFKFAATVSIKDTGVSKFVRDAVRREKLQKELKQHSVLNLIERKRSDQKLKANSDRFKVISKKRAVKFEDLDDKPEEANEFNSELSDLYRLYDVVGDEVGNGSATEGDGAKHSEKEDSDVVTCNGVPMVREKVKDAATNADDYVYDIYYLNKAGFDFSALDNILTIEAMIEQYLVDDYRGDEVGEVYDEEDDENDESNWRNDYPEEDPHYFENGDLDYHYDDVRDGGFAVNDLGSMISNQLTLDNDDEDKYSSAEEGDHLDLNELLQLNDLWTPTTSYEAYKTKTMKELDKDDG